MRHWNRILELAFFLVLFVLGLSYFGVQTLNAGLRHNDRFYLFAGGACTAFALFFLYTLVIQLGQEVRASRRWRNRISQL